MHLLTLLVSIHHRLEMIICSFQQTEVEEEFKYELLGKKCEAKGIRDLGEFNQGPSLVR